MYDNVRDGWIRDSLDLLARFQFTRRGAEVLRNCRIALIPYAEVAESRGPCIAVPVDLPSPSRIAHAWTVPFGATTLRVWNRIPQPASEWKAIPGEAAPLWWRHPTGTLVPAWNLWANVADLLTFREERECSVRDEHGRFPAATSPRAALGLLDVPAVNDANAALLDAAAALAGGHEPRLSLDAEFLEPPSLALSHDLDQLRGNDPITQAVRGYRAALALARGQMRSASRHAVAAATNMVRPRAYFAGNLRGMLDVERMFGFTSVSYFLTGQGGRFGARSGDAIARETAASLPLEWEAGVHYNYMTVGSDERLASEIRVIREASGRDVIAGRAHYLRFDPLTSPAFVARHGIRVDESIGWASALSYRAGIAGPFYPREGGTGGVVNVLELPLTCMDAPLAAAGTVALQRMWQHLSNVGGVLTVLFHPGAFHNPEQPEYDGLYERILGAAYRAGSRSWTPSQMLDALLA